MKDNSSEQSITELDPKELKKKKEFHDYLRFGSVDASILIIGLLCGFSLETAIAKRVGVKGYGAIIGGGIANATADTLAGLSNGTMASLGAGVGAMIPMIPVFAALRLRTELNRVNSFILATSCGAIMGGTYCYTLFRMKQIERT